MKVLLTGASGFVGNAILATAKQRDLLVTPVFRSLEAAKICGYAPGGCVIISSQMAETNWGEALLGINVVIHCAARTHVLSEAEVDPLTTYRLVNVEGALNLARQAAQAGVRRFVFVSSIKVNGEMTHGSHRFACDDVPAPEDDYGRSKAEAEAGLWRLIQETGMEVVIIRSPLVYGRGAKGNFASLLAWVRRGLPLPLGAVTQNRRSLVGVDNLVDLILTCLQHPKASNQTFLVSDGEDLSTTELLQRMGKAMNRPVRLLPVPLSLLVFVARLLGKRAVAQRLLGSLQVDISKTCDLLDWKPLVSVDEGLRRAAQQRL
jgi:nucleoside-diphosphate-sugar epimerase